MNYEQPHSHGDRPDAVPSIVTISRGNAPSNEAGDRIRDAYAHHGNGFAAYLSLDHVNPYSETLEADFAHALEGIYRDRTALVDETINAFGWYDKLDRLSQTDPEFGDVLNIDRDAVWDVIQQHFDVIQIGSVCYVFETRGR
ncbi:hypothetical protein HWD35_18950 [Tsukamurella tyrosinosolvens]|uniref:hypothetical protein n=1 Tax=Tsukamurella tyrosinosolvens TaxID=57704 RepID=UPI001CE09B00|nr:hypothetical protein [Tsukamurella tyrosinosolvens]MCA4996798.1 hypothetical protein [Tsukamurella tyrosinosolvens]